VRNDLEHLAGAEKKSIGVFSRAAIDRNTIVVPTSSAGDEQLLVIPVRHHTGHHATRVYRANHKRSLGHKTGVVKKLDGNFLQDNRCNRFAFTTSAKEERLTA